MTGSLCGLARGRRNHGSAVGRGAGFWPGPRTAEAGCSVVGRWLFGEDSEQCQLGGTRRPSSHPAQIGQYQNKIKSCDPNLVFSQQTCDHSRTLLLISQCISSDQRDMSFLTLCVICIFRHTVFRLTAAAPTREAYTRRELQSPLNSSLHRMRVPDMDSHNNCRAIDKSAHDAHSYGWRPDRLYPHLTCVQHLWLCYSSKHGKQIITFHCIFMLISYGSCSGVNVVPQFS